MFYQTLEPVQATQCECEYDLKQIGAEVLSNTGFFSIKGKTVLLPPHGSIG